MGQFDSTDNEFEKLHREILIVEQIVLKIYDLMPSQNDVSDGSFAAQAGKGDPSEERPDFVLARFARKLSLARRDRKNAVTAGLFHDPAWDILLDIFIAHAQEKYISISGASLAGHVPESTAIRWVWALEKAGLIKRKPDQTDKRRNIALLSDTGLFYMRQVLNAIANRFMSPL